MEYYKLIDNRIIKAKSVERIDGVWVSNPTAEQYAKIGAYPRDDASFAPPDCDEGFHAVHDGYDVVDGKWTRKWRVEPITYTVDDYNRALEDYIRSVRVKRGYDEREPTSYLKSRNPRWQRDAEDWVEFVDTIMLYALPILNEYKATGNAPSLKDFKAGFPKMEWTITEEGE